MTYLEYMENHPDENLSWCRPYTNDAEDHFLIMHEGETLEIHAPGYEGNRYDGTLPNYMEQFTRELAGENYDLYSGYTDEQIALMYLHEVGCASCPARHVCEAMLDQMEE